MPNWLKALIAGYGAKKLGGGCLSTILVFIIIGQCNRPAVRNGNIKSEQHKTTSALIRGKQTKLLQSVSSPVFITGWLFAG